jgi:hypothetical protein
MNISEIVIKLCSSVCVTQNSFYERYIDHVFQRCGGISLRYKSNKGYKKEKEKQKIIILIISNQEELFNWSIRCWLNLIF